MHIHLRSIVRFMLFVILFSGFRGGRYFFENRIQEIGIAFCVILFVYSSVMCALLVPRSISKWNVWTFSTVIIISYTMILPGIIFAVNNQVSAVPSIFASREFLFISTCPVLYFLYRIGYSLEFLEETILAALTSVMLLYLVLSFTLPLEQWYFGADRYKSALVSNDSWRGFRLLAPPASLQLCFFIYLYKLIYNTKKLIWLLLLLATVIALWQYQSRSLFVAIPLGILFYTIFVRNYKHFPILLFGTPFLIFGLYLLGLQFFELLSVQSAAGEDARMPMYKIAFETILSKPFFGMGMSSYFSLTDSEIFNIWFHPVDIGIVGIAYRYGLIGAFLYFSFVLYLFALALKTNFIVTNKFRSTNAFIFAFICRMTADVFKYILSVDYIISEGIVLASVFIVLCYIYIEDARRTPSIQV